MLGANPIIMIQTIVNSQKIASISIFPELWLYEFALEYGFKENTLQAILTVQKSMIDDACTLISSKGVGTGYMKIHSEMCMIRVRLWQ